MDNDEIFKRFQLKEDLKSECLGSIDAKIDRWLEIEHQEIIGGHHFASASSECIKLYRDGYFIGTVMMSHAINEGIINFVAERNNIDRQKADNATKTIVELIVELQGNNLISTHCKDASLAIWHSYRNDIHHMNPSVLKIHFPKLAQLNIKHLSFIENEISGCDYPNGALVPHQPKYWDKNADGRYKSWLRLD
ncbi:hypothetical protein ACFLUZ_04305 [Chloroflexota bacterium]